MLDKSMGHSPNAGTDTCVVDSPKSKTDWCFLTVPFLKFFFLDTTYYPFPGSSQLKGLSVKGGKCLGRNLWWWHGLLPPFNPAQRVLRVRYPFPSTAREAQYESASQYERASTSPPCRPKRPKTNPSLLPGTQCKLVRANRQSRVERGEARRDL